MFDEGIDGKYAGRIQAQSDKGSGKNAYIAGRDRNEYSIGNSDEKVKDEG